MGDERPKIKVPTPAQMAVETVEFRTVVGKDGIVRYERDPKFDEFKDYDLADWEKELLGMGSTPQRYYVGSGSEMIRGALPSGHCGDPNCPMCNSQQERQAPTCPRCREKDEAMARLRKDAEKEIARVKAEEQEQRQRVSNLKAELIKAEEDLKKATEERNAFDTEADLLAQELEQVTDQRDTVMEMLMWSEEQLLKAWEQIEELKGAA